MRVANGLAVNESYSDPSSNVLASLMDPSIEKRVLAPALDIMDAFVDGMDNVEDVSDSDLVVGDNG